MQFATTSKSGVGNSPGGRPFSTHVPRLRVMPTPCLKSSQRGSRDQNAICAAAGSFFHRSNRIIRLGIDDEISAELFGVGELAIIHVNRANVKPP